MMLKQAAMSEVSNACRVACVTGGAKRIGRALVLALHQANYNIIIHYHTSESEAIELVNYCNAIRPQSAKSVQGDLEDFETLPQLTWRIINSFGRLDCLVHNASRFYPTPFGQISQQDWQNLFLTNAQTPLFISQYLYPYLKKSQGCIISILDIHANGKPFGGYTVYNMAKAAHQMMVQSLAIELAPDIRVNGIAPGINILPIEGSEQALTAETIDKICRAVPLKRIGTPQDIAQVAVFLAAAPYITGQIIAVDGGRGLTLAGNESR